AASWVRALGLRGPRLGLGDLALVLDHLGAPELHAPSPTPHPVPQRAPERAHPRRRPYFPGQTPRSLGLMLLVASVLFLLGGLVQINCGGPTRSGSRPTERSPTGTCAG